MTGNKKYHKYIIGNKEKTKFLGYDATQFRSVCVDSINDKNVLILSQGETDMILSDNKYTNFYIVNDLKYKYKVMITLEQGVYENNNQIWKNIRNSKHQN